MPDRDPLVFSTHPLHPAAEARLKGVARLEIASALDFEALAREAEDADIVIVRANLPPALFDRAKRLRAAVRHGAGLDMIPVEAATKSGVIVANVPGVNARSVAEHVLFVAMALLRRFRMVDRDLRTQGWLAGRSHATATNELSGRTIGIVGMGHIGHAVAEIAAKGFALDVIANSRNPRSVPDTIPYRDVDDLAGEADIIVLCCPLTPETRGMIDARRIARMKPGAIIINVARGPVIDDDALVAALRDGRIGGAALDVFAEQPLPADHPYFSFDNVIVTPHMAGITKESMARMGLGAVEETLRVLAGDLPVNFCNPEVESSYRQRFPLGRP
ncbi:hydroxyacid dehydrogenase [Nitratireductor mangrovi]|uniref:Hydroxyacid dehydrogenase n=1 Tax=Nitratireductor mangrovi TaxID=2599600 RepID=A0A5B8L4P1_9HYPH|nr:hydroxyacid dehydrogenase [Nitratireductor mangrovi]QDZ02834.1 hydroxyacid dehydrogenase [Nitratireductor mangrovi]